MLFKPRKIFSLWDTWCYYHNDTYYLYYLDMGPTERQGWHGQGVAMATSNDGVHWDEIGLVLPKDDGATGMGTGAVWKATDFEKSGKFIMNYSTWFDWCIQSQSIRFAESTDLIHWTRLGPASDFAVRKESYEHYPEFPNARWDCIYAIPKPDGKGLYGYWTALPKGRPGFGFGETSDGVRWKALEPPVIEGAGQGEAGAVERIGDKYYLLYHGGKCTMLADSPGGPYQAAQKNRDLIPGECYFARFFPTPHALLVNHQSFPRLNGVPNGLCRMAPLKKAMVDADGALRLHYWEGNDKLKGRALNLAPVSSEFVQWLGARFDPKKGLVLEGSFDLTGQPPGGQDVGPRPGAPLKGASACGLYIEWEPGRGTYILSGRNGVTEIGLASEDGGRLSRENMCDREASLGETAPFRLLLKDSLAELYVGDLLIHIFSLPGAATGRIGLIGRQAKELLRQCRAWEMT